MVVTQVTAEQGANIGQFWRKTMYKVKPNGQPDIPHMPKYAFDNAPPGTYNCTGATYDSLLAASRGGAGSVLGLPLLRELLGKARAANPSMFLKLLLAHLPYIGNGLRRTAGPNLNKRPVNEYEWTTTTDKNGTRGQQQHWW